MLKESNLNQNDVFVQNPHYWGPKPAIKKITVQVIADPTSRAIAFETGVIDFLYGDEGVIPLDTFHRISQSKQYQTQLSAPVETIFVALNSQHSPTNEQTVREAFNYGIDKNTLVKTTLYVIQQPAEFIFPPNTPYADVDLPKRQFDPDKAKRILADDGWIIPEGERFRQKAGKPLQIELVFPSTDALSKSIAEVIQANLAQIGVNVRLTGEEPGSVFARQRDGRFDMVLSRTWGAPYDPPTFTSSMRTPSHADYQAQLGLPDKAKIDQMISQVLITTDEQQRAELYHKIIRRLHGSAVYIPISYVSIMSLSRPELGPIPFAPVTVEIPFEQIHPIVQ